MASNLANSFNDLKEALLALKPTGSDGFEGLLACILGKITGHPFRLAGSGSQHGKDGEAISNTSHITFEGKLYSGPINKNEVFSKLTEIIGSSEIPDVWVLGATIEIKTQIRETLRVAAEKNSIATLFLDWSTAPSIPPLATACAISEEETYKFLENHVKDKTKVKKAKAVLTSIRAHNNYQATKSYICQALREPSLGAPIALRANHEWLTTAFSDRKRAKLLFGQPLAPLAQTPLPLFDRKNLIAVIENHIFGELKNKIIVLRGGEGCGKSWLFAQSWLASQERPLTIVISATDLKINVAQTDIEPFLIMKLIEQMGDSTSDFNKKRWQKKFGQWRTDQNRSAPKLIVYVDGLNQQPEFKWTRWLDGTNQLLKRLGGVLALSAREGYFGSRIMNGLMSPTYIIPVPEWTKVELTQILDAKGIEIDKLNPDVENTLKNPRVLAIAFDLLEDKRIEDFNELSVERLLFEHIRMSTREGNAFETPEQFIKRLSEHAQAIISRIKEQKHEDRLVFESAHASSVPSFHLSADLLAVAEGRFFSPLPEDSTLYSLSDDGLVLALGLSVIKALQKSERNQKNISETLEEILEPIGALDKTAEVVFAALLVASIDHKCSLDIRRVLIYAYLCLQNIDNNNYPAFVSATRNATEAAMKALFDLATTTSYTANKDWLLAALREQQCHAECWNVMSRYLKDWLRAYSLTPERGMASRLNKDDPQKLVEQTEKQRKIIQKRQQELSSEEAKFLTEKMCHHDGLNSAMLSSDAFALMTGMPLSGFVKSLVAWSFSQALNSSLHTPRDEFHFLIQFNQCDWRETRERLLAEASIFQGSEVSRTGKWALVEILRATSTEDDAEQEVALVEELTAEREKFSGWRLVEKYCATDPCDPTSETPANITDTAEKYRQVSLSNVCRSLGMTIEEFFLQDALPGLARFSSKTAIEVQRSLADEVSKRNNHELQLGLFSLEPNTAIISAQTISRLLEKAVELNEPYLPDSEDARDKWFSSQYSLLIAFPHLDGDTQLDTLISLPSPGPVLLQLTNVLEPADPAKLDNALNSAIQSGDSYKQQTVLIFARYSHTQISKQASEMIQRLVLNPDPSIRAEAIDVIAYLKNTVLIKFFLDTGWSASTLDPKKHYFEIWYGSRIIIQAGKLGFLNAEEVLDRISPMQYSAAALALGDDAKKIIADRLHASILRSLEIELPFRPPEVEQSLDTKQTNLPPLKSLSDSDQNLSADESFKRFSETPEEFHEQQKQGWDTFNRFELSLTKENARLIIENVGCTAIESYVTADPERAKKLAESFLHLPERKLMCVQNIGLMMAEKLSELDPLLTKKLFVHLASKCAFVKLVFGTAGISLELKCVWNSADNEEMNALREERLDRALSDSAISLEVATALTFGKSRFLEHYVNSRIERDEPTMIARALMVCGFGDAVESTEERLTRFSAKKGLIGKAAKAARYAYDRNCWSRHWFTKMCQTSSAEDFWRFSILFLKIVDVRYDLWKSNIKRSGEPIKKFEPSIQRQLESRVKKWKTQRKKTLFGFKAPPPFFVALD